VNRKALLLFTVTSVIWGSSFLFIRLAVGHMPPSAVVFGRTVLGAAFLVPLAARNRAFRGLRPLLLPIVVVTLVDMALPTFLTAWGEQHVTSSAAGILTATDPLFTAILAWWLIRSEAVDRTRFAGLIVGLAGVAALLGIDLHGSAIELAGAGAVLLSALGYAAAALLYRRWLADVPALAVTALMTAISSVLFLGPAAAGLPAKLPPAGTIAALAVLGVVNTGLAYWLFYLLIDQAGAATAAVITYVMPVVALVLGVGLLGEKLTIGAIAGLPLIAVGAWLATRAGPDIPGRLRRVHRRLGREGEVDRGVAVRVFGVPAPQVGRVAVQSGQVAEGGRAEQLVGGLGRRVAGPGGEQDLGDQRLAGERPYDQAVAGPGGACGHGDCAVADQHARGGRVVGEVADPRGEPGGLAGELQLAPVRVIVRRGHHPVTVGQVGQVDGLPGGQRMAFRDGHQHRLEDQGAQPYPGHVLRAGVVEPLTDRHVDEPGRQHPQHVMGGRLDVRGNLVITSFAFQLVDEAAEHQQRGRPDPQRRPLGRRLGQMLPGRPHQFVHVRDQRPGPADDKPAQRGRLGPMRAADEQPPAEHPLDPGKLRGERGLADPQLRGRLGLAAGLRDGQHDPQMPQLQFGHNGHIPGSAIT
jgi:drug/metabolite transporter (DMT)-like permease